MNSWPPSDSDPLSRPSPPLIGRHCYMGIPLVSPEDSKKELRPQYNPVTGAIAGPPLSTPQEASLLRVVELPHHYLAATATMHLQRQIVACIHEFIAAIGGIYRVPDAGYHGHVNMSGNVFTSDIPAGQPAIPSHIVCIPSMDNCEILYYLDRIASHIHRETLLIQEAFALFVGIEAIRSAKRSSRDWANGIDPDALEEAAVTRIDADFNQIDLPYSFSDVYSRYSRVCRANSHLHEHIAAYSLNGTSFQFLVPIALVQMREQLGSGFEKALLTEELRLRRGLDQSLSMWDSPTARMIRAIEVSERMGSETAGSSAADCMQELALRLADFDASMQMQKADSGQISHSFLDWLTSFRSARYPWSTKLWELTRGEAHSAKSLLQALGKGVDESPGWETLEESLQPSFYIERLADQGSYRLHCNRPEDQLMLLDALELEFLRTQLFAGQGLTCIFDVLADIDHPTPVKFPPDVHAHLMECIWKSTRLDDSHSSEMYWEPPSCLSMPHEYPS